MSDPITLLGFPMPIGGPPAAGPRTAMPITFRRAHVTAIGPQFETPDGPMFALNAMGAQYLIMGALDPVYDLLFPPKEDGHAGG